MGLKVSTTCELTVGPARRARQGLAGRRVHDGIGQMFDVIENARMMVGTKAIATLSTGYLNALEYAKSRVQGADLTQMTDKAAPRVTITITPTCAGSLMTAEGLRRGPARAVPLHGDLSGRVQIAETLHGVQTPTWPSALNDLMLPVVKGVGFRAGLREAHRRACRRSAARASCRTTRSSSTSGTPKIDSLYEGTTAIQAQDFFFRKIVRDKGQALAYVSGEIQKFVDSESGNGRLKTEREQLGKALADVQAMAATMTGYLMDAQQNVTSLYKVGLGSVRFLMSVGDLIIGWLLQQQAAVAVAALDAGATGDDRSFYEGKVAVASFFAKNFLPLLASTREVIETLDNDIMELDEAAF